ncbi:MAG TPA: serine hydrolase [Candidatus Acidoferrum sp.]|nr:serine hydrolase [Candidatus Acidoferrum sp.]
MTSRGLLLGFFYVLTSPLGTLAQDAKLEDAIQDIETRIQKSGADVGVAFRTLDGKMEWFSRADDVFHAASTMKVPVMIELFHQVKQAKLKLDDSLTVKNEFHSLVDASVYTLDPADDSETELYKAAGQTRTLSQLCELMITVSSNLATNLLVEKLGVDNIHATVHALHADGMDVLRGVEDNKAYEKGMNNTTTARGLLILLEAIANGQAIDPVSSRQMVEILARQKFNEAIPAGLPSGTRVAHKTGELTKLHHDAAIVYAPRPFVLVILVRGLAESKDSAALMADITRRIYQSAQQIHPSASIATSKGLEWILRGGARSSGQRFG